MVESEFMKILLRRLRFGRSAVCSTLVAQLYLAIHQIAIRLASVAEILLEELIIYRVALVKVGGLFA